MGQTADTVERAAQAADEHDADTEEIKARIEQTRAEMSDTIDAIQHKLSPDTIKEQAVDSVKDMTEAAKEAAKEAVREAFDQTKHAIHGATIGKVETIMGTTRETAREKSSGILDTIRQNPVPAALAAIGIGWLVMKGRSSDDDWSDDYRPDYRYQRDQPYQSRSGSVNRAYGSNEWNFRYEDDGQSKVAEVAEGAKEKVGDLASGAKDAVSSAASAVAGAVGSVAGGAKDAVGTVAGGTKDTVGSVAGGTRERAGELGYYAGRRARRAKGGVEQMLEDNPLALGAVALALGTAVGLGVPETQREHEMFGPMRDNLIDKAKPMVQEKLEQVQTVAKEVASTVQHEAQIAADNIKVDAQLAAEKEGLTQQPKEPQGQNRPQGQGMGQTPPQGQGQGLSQGQPRPQGQGTSQNQGQWSGQGQNQGQNRPQGQGMNQPQNQGQGSGQGQNRPQGQGQSQNPGQGQNPNKPGQNSL
jgi:hypothetical protein